MNNMNTRMMGERNCALSLGIIFLFVGLAGFVPAFVWVPGEPTSTVPLNGFPDAYATGFGYVFGLFPTNLLHNLIHCTVGLLGITSYGSLVSSRLYNRGFAIAYLLIALMGLVPGANTTFGFMPIFGNNVWFNALTAAVAGYFGFFKPTETENMPTSSEI